MVKPLLSIDIESTGVDPAKDRIVSLSMILATDVDVDGPSDWNYLIDPQQPIPPEATACHGIRDEDVKDCPPFDHYAAEIYQYIRDCDLIGFNLTNFDIPILWEELYRAGIEWDLSNVNVIDVGTLFKKREERTLAAAVKFYCGRELEGAHDANIDAMATIDVWRAMLQRYPDLVGLDRQSQAKASQYDEVRVDLAGKIIIGKDGRPTYNIGKAKGVAVEDDPGFGRWMLGKDFTENTKMHIEKILYPETASV